MSPSAGILLTGGASRRMGADKAALSVGGVPMAVRLGAILRAGLDGPVIEVGPGRSGLPTVSDAGIGPLTALAAAARALEAWDGPAVVLACDLPRFSPEALDLLAGWPGDGAVLPVIGGRRQPLCARWAATDLTAACRRAADGQRSLRGLPGAGACTTLTEADLPPGVGAEVFLDVDSPEDLATLGVHLDPPADRPAAGEPAVAGRRAR